MDNTEMGSRFHSLLNKITQLLFLIGLIVIALLVMAFAFERQAKRIDKIQSQYEELIKVKNFEL